MAYDFSILKKHITETEEWLTRELSGVRTGRATPMILDSVKTDAYGTRTLIRELANISVEDARTLRISPWDKGLLKPIEKSIADADLGISVSADDQGLRIAFPELTSERRTQLSKIAADKTEQARVTLRGHRTDAMKTIDALQKEGMSEDVAKREKEEVQKLIDAGTESLSENLKRKETEIAK